MKLSEEFIQKVRKKAKGLGASEGGKGESYRFTNIRGGLCGTRESTSLKFSGKLILNTP